MSKADVKFPSGGGGTGLEYWIESEDATTQQSTEWTPSNAATNVNAVILPKGNGANLAQTPDGTSAGGNARGHYATDWQKRRNAADEVASGNDSTLSGGRNNKASGTDSSIGGGRNNTASSTDTTISGGRDSTASGADSVVSGGKNNIASGGKSVISGGHDNTASGDDSNITGGTNNQATQTNSRAGGINGKADRLNSDVFAWDVPELGQHIKVCGSQRFVEVTPSGGTFTMATMDMIGNNSTVLLNLKMIIRDSGGGGYLGTGTVETFNCELCVKTAGGTAAIIGTPAISNQFGDFSVAGTTLTFSLLGTTLFVKAVFPSGSGSNNIFYSYWTFEGVEQRI